MITNLVLSDFKGHRRTVLKLGRFTMLCGDNASGKTSVLDALAILAGLGRDPRQALRDDWAPADLLRRGATAPLGVTATAVRRGKGSMAGIELQLEAHGSSRDEPGWSLVLKGNDGAPFTAKASKGGLSAGWEKLGATVGTARLFRLSAERVAAAAYSDQAESAVGPDGTNTAVVLAALKLGNDEAFARIETAMRHLIPAIERIRIRPAAVVQPSGANIVGSKLYFDFHGAPSVPAHGASHGTLIALALLTILHGDNRPNLILLDDFDHALHPRAQIELVRMIKALLALPEFEDLQIVATTHSPYTLDELDPTSVYVFALGDDGTVHSKLLSEHPQAARVEGTLTAGQLWSLDPERDWVLGS